MATTSIAGDVFQLTVRAHCLGQEIDNVWYGRLGGSYDGAAFGSDYDMMQQLANQISLSWNVNAMSILVDEYVFDQVEVKRIGGTAAYVQRVKPGQPPKFAYAWTFDLAYAYGTIFSGQTGAVVGQKVNATEDAFTLRLITQGNPRRRANGSKRISCVQDLWMEDNIIVMTNAPAVALIFDSFRTDFAADGIVRATYAALVVASAKTRALLINPYAWDIIANPCSPIIGSQNSRKQKRRYA